MLTIHEEYVTDRAGERKAVLVPITEWDQILEALDDLEDLRAYDEAKREPSDPIAFEQIIPEVMVPPDYERARVDKILIPGREERTARERPRFNLAPVEHIEIPSRGERNDCFAETPEKPR